MDKLEVCEVRASVGVVGELSFPCRLAITPDGENSVRLTVGATTGRPPLVFIVDGPAAIRAISDCINWTRNEGRLI